MRPRGCRLGPTRNPVVSSERLPQWGAFFFSHGDSLISLRSCCRIISQAEMRNRSIVSAYINDGA